MEVLIADDDSSMAALIAVHLREIGYEPCIVRNGTDALKIIEERDLRLLIVDWMMPGIDGIELCRRLRARGQAGDQYRYIIMVTVRTGRRSHLVALEAGADDFIEKPVDLELLGARVLVARRILDLQHEVRRLESLLAICMRCKKIRNEEQVWEPVDHYVARQTDTRFSHGLCPGCYDEYAAEIDAELGSPV